MSKQGELLDVELVTDWKAVEAKLSARDHTIVKYVRSRPGRSAREIGLALGMSVNSLNYRLWELCGVSTGPAKGDGLLYRQRHEKGAGPFNRQGPWRYYARDV